MHGIACRDVECAHYFHTTAVSINDLQLYVLQSQHDLSLPLKAPAHRPIICEGLSCTLLYNFVLSFELPVFIKASSFVGLSSGFLKCARGRTHGILARLAVTVLMKYIAYLISFHFHQFYIRHNDNIKGHRRPTSKTKVKNTIRYKCYRVV